MAARIRELEQENRFLKDKEAQEQYPDLDTSLSSSGPQEYEVLPLALESPRAESSCSEVQRHKAFILHMKRTLQALLVERAKERKEHLRTKAELETLLRTCRGLGGFEL
jgi:hypothetical protein